MRENAYLKEENADLNSRLNVAQSTMPMEAYTEQQQQYMQQVHPSHEHHQQQQQPDNE